MNAQSEGDPYCQYNQSSIKNLLQKYGPLSECVFDLKSCLAPEEAVCEVKLLWEVWLQLELDAVGFNRQLMHFAESLLGAAWHTYNMIPR